MWIFVCHMFHHQDYNVYINSLGHLSKKKASK